MNKDYVFIHEIPRHTLKWTIKVKVVRQSGPYRSKDGKIEYKKLTLMDEKGMTMQASIFGDDIRLFEHTLLFGKSYYVSRGYLEKTKPEFRSRRDREHEYQMTIKKYTNVEEAEDCDIKMPVKKFNFMPLRELSLISTVQENIDIVAIVLKVSPEEKRKRKHDSADVLLRDIKLTDSSLQSAILSMWGSFVHTECEMICEMLPSRPIIVATNLQAKEVYGRKILSTSSATDILINPDIPEVKELEAWKMNSKNELDSLSEGNEVMYSTDQIVTIEHILKTGNMNETYCIKASVTSILPQEQCWYVACSNCRRKTEAAQQTQFTCQGCGNENVIAEPWFCVKVELGDNSGSVGATIFGNQAGKLLSCNVESVMGLSIEEHFDQLDKWMVECRQNEYIFWCKLVKTRSSDRLSVVALRDLA